MSLAYQLAQRASVQVSIRPADLSTRKQQTCIILSLCSVQATRKSSAELDLEIKGK
jgi:hypothetical protein